MNNSFDFVMRASLNNSKTKETHLFPKAKRLTGPQPSNCRKSSYDLSKTMLVSELRNKSITIPREQRFKRSQSPSPPPNYYHHHSFIDLNRSYQKGNTFGHQKKEKFKLNNVPGPGAYSSFNPQTNLAYTMRKKFSHKNNGPNLGPGQYQIDNHEATTNTKIVTSKYNNSKCVPFGNEKRFKAKQFNTEGPGPVTHSKAGSELKTQPSYTFSTTIRQAILKTNEIKKKGNPGPGSYNQFSEFSELKGGLANSRTLRYA